MRIVLAADHAGYEMARKIQAQLHSSGHQVLDVGSQDPNAPDDYPDFAEALGGAVVDGRAERGVLICGSGVGACIAANKIPGVRAGICHDTYSARQGVEHDDMNVLVLGSRIIGSELARELVNTFLQARFTGEERHCRRLAKIGAIERKHGRVG